MFENPDEVIEDEAYLDTLTASDSGLQLPTSYLSYSQINLYGNCGERYRRKYVLGNRQPGSSNMAHGRLMHHIIENMLLHKRDKGVPPKEFHHDLLSSKMTEYFEEVDTWDPKIPDMKVAENASRELLDIYYRDRLPEVRVRDVELKLNTRLRGRIPFVGYIDLVEKGPLEDTNTDDPFYDPTEIQSTDSIRDTKITGRKYGKARVENSLQLTLYAEALDVEDVGFDLLVQKKRSEFVGQRSTRNRGEKEHALDVVDDIANAISAGVFMKTNPEHWMCSKKWCPFWDQCRGRHLQVSGVDTSTQTEDDA